MNPSFFFKSCFTVQHVPINSGQCVCAPTDTRVFSSSASAKRFKDLHHKKASLLTGKLSPGDTTSQRCWVRARVQAWKTIAALGGAYLLREGEGELNAEGQYLRRTGLFHLSADRHEPLYIFIWVTLTPPECFRRLFVRSTPITGQRAHALASRKKLDYTS